jgi:hypothetical protein
LAALVLGGCATQKPAPSQPQTTSIRRISIQPFEGTGGTDVTREITAALKAAGWSIAEKGEAGDVTLWGMVTDYRANQKLMIFLGETNIFSGNKSVTVSNPLVSMSGSQVLPQGPSISLTNPHVVLERAIVGISARLITHPKQGIIWSDGFSYESLTLQHARHVAVSTLVRSLSRAAPHVRRAPPAMGGQN